ncbi:MAG: GntR family transcriptional regulator [Zoogloeaceae bacterium]|jgi:GntR family transcriptional regulator|nr:GntR family transcriptional regulator [Zoogloeaceae bacterium]
MTHFTSPPSSFVTPPRQAAARPAASARAVSAPAFTPLYQQIKTLILQALGQGEWAPGVMIPSEAELAARFGVSQGTVRKAVDELASENLLVRLQGKGTFVASHNDPHAYYRFLRLRADAGETRETRSRALSCTSARADSAIAKALEQEEGAEVVTLTRILFFADDPVVYDEIALAADLFGQLTLERLAAQEERSLYSFFERSFGVRMIRAEERLRAVAARKDVADHLGFEAGSPLLLIDRISRTYAERPVEWRRSFCRTDAYHYFNELS